MGEGNPYLGLVRGLGVSNGGVAADLNRDEGVAPTGGALPDSSPVVSSVAAEAGIRQSLLTAVDKNPEDEARLRDLAGAYGLPVAAVRLDRETVERRAKLDSVPYAEIIKSLPATRELLQDPAKAAVAHDDVENLSALETALRFGRNSGRAALAGVFGFGEGVAGLGEAGADLARRFTSPLAATGVLPVDIGGPVAEAFKGIRQNQAAWRDYLKPKAETNLGAGYYSGLESLTQNLLTLPMALAAGNPALALNSVAAMTGGQSYGKARDAGQGLERSALYGAGDAAIEYATEMLPMRYLFKDLKAGAPFFKTLTHQLATEIPGEEAATALQDLNEWSVLHPEKTLDDYLAERPDAALQTLVATAVGSGGQVSLLHTVDKLVNRDKYLALRADESAKWLDTVNGLAEASKVLGRSPEVIREFVEGMTAGTSPTVGTNSGAHPTESSVPEALYIDAQAFAQSGVAEQVAAAVPGIAAQFETALATGGEIRIPLADYVTRIAPNKAFAQPLREHLRLPDEQFSRAQATEYMANHGEALRKEIEQTLQRKEQDSEWQGSVDKVRAAIKEALSQLGRHSDTVNEQYAALHAAYFGTMAERLGVLPEALFKSSRLNFANGATSKGEFAQVLAEAMPDGMEAGDGAKAAAMYRGEDGARAVLLGQVGGKLLQDLAALSMRRYPVTTDVQQVLDSAADSPNVRNDDGHKPILSNQGDIFKQGGITHIEHNGILRPIFNSLGLPIQPDAEGIRRFWDWFGDSRVVDAQGRPLVVYQGATGDFDTFDFNRTADEALSAGKGAYLSTDPEAASEYASGIPPGNTGALDSANVMPLYLKMLKPFDGEAVYQLKDFESVLPLEILDKARSAAYPNSEWINDVKETLASLYQKLEDLENRFLDEEIASKYQINRGDYASDAAYANGISEAVAGETRFTETQIGRYENTLGAARISAREKYENTRFTGDEIWRAIKASLPDYHDWQAERGLLAGESGDLETDTVVAGLLFHAFGFDGIKRTDTFPVNNPHTVYIANNPAAQIKSATGNSGAFNPADDSILQHDKRGADAPDDHAQAADRSRGSYNPYTRTITFKPDADLSTFLHESAHFFLDMQFELAADLLGKAATNSAEELQQRGRPRQPKQPEAKADKPVDMFSAAFSKGLSNDRMPPGDYGHKTRLQVESIRRLGAEVVNTPDEAAQALAYLARNAPERAEGLVTDVNGKPLAVVGGFKGSVDQVPFFVDTLLSDVFRIKGAANLWMAHNHPAGLGVFSGEDLQANKLLGKVFQGSKIKLRGFLLYGGQYNGTAAWAYLPGPDADARWPEHFSRSLQAASISVPVPLVERVYVDETPLGPQFGFPLSKSSIMDLANGRSGLVMFDGFNRPVAFLEISNAMGKTLRRDGRMDALYRAISMANPSHMVLIAQGLGRDAIHNLIGFFNTLDRPLKDVIMLWDGQVSSRAENGLRLHPDKEFEQGPVQRQVDLRFVNLASGSKAVPESDSAPLEAATRQQLLADTQVLLDWFGLETVADWQNLDMAAKRRCHEQFAEAFERYLFEGKAPSLGLAALFERFRAWLLSVYRSLRNLNAAKLHPEVKAVFDRLLASDAEIRLAEQAAGLRKPLAAAAKTGMNAADLQAYRLLDQAASGKALGALHASALRDMQWLQTARAGRLKEMQQRHQALRETLRTELQAQVLAQPLYRAWRLLAGKQAAAKIDQQAVAAMALPVKMVSRLRKLNMLAASGGRQPDSLAAEFGFSSGSELLQKLAVAEAPHSLIRRLTAEKLLQEHGELSSAAAIRRTAHRAAHNDDRGRVLALEAQALTVAAGEPPLAAGLLQQYAQAMLDRQPLRDVQPESYMRAEARAAAASEQAMTAGQLKQAAFYKRQQLLNFYAVAAAYKVEAELQAGLRYLHGAAGFATELDAEFAAQIKNLLLRFGLSRLVAGADSGQRAQAKTGLALADCLSSLRKQGLEPPIPDWLASPAAATDYRNLNPHQFNDLLTTIRQLEHLGRQRQQLFTLSPPSALPDIKRWLVNATQNRRAA